MNEKQWLRFCRKLLSTVWEKRLEAYEKIAADLKRAGCEIFDGEHADDAMLLTGQIVSIHFKRYFHNEQGAGGQWLTNLYLRLLSPLKTDTSRGYERTRQLFLDIYDDDDYAAQKEIGEFFSGETEDAAPNENRSIIANIFACYMMMMQRVRRRMISFAAGDAGAALA